MRDEIQEHPDWFDQRATITTIVLAIGIGILDLLFQRDVSDFRIVPGIVRLEPWRLVTCALVHGGAVHLLFNVMAMSSFGRALEPILGLGRTSLAYVLLAAGSMGAEYAFWGQNPIGLSGVVFGQIGILWGLGRWHPRMLGLLPERVVRFAVGLFFLLVGLTAAGVLRVANVAHLSGALLGVLMGWQLARPAELRKMLDWVPVAATSLIVLLALFGRQSVNLSGRTGDDGKDRVAIEHLGRDENEEALALLEVAVQEDPAKWRAWFNLGVTRWRLDDREGALEAFLRAYALEPMDERSKANIQHVRHELTNLALSRKDPDTALRLTEEAILFDPEDADAFAYRGIAWTMVGDWAQALEEYERAASSGTCSIEELDVLIEEAKARLAGG